MLNLEQIIEILEKNRNKWNLGTHQGNDGNQGNTLEGILGVLENNFSLPDLGEFELKTQKLETDSFITLFHKEPYPAASTPQVIKSLGWKHQKAGTKYDINEMRFSSTTYGHKHTNRGFIIKLTKSKIEFVFEPALVKRNALDRSKAYKNLGDWADDIENRTLHYSKILPIYWDRQEFEDNCRKKLDNTLICFCKTKEANGKKYFNFTEAFIYSKFLSNKLEDLFLDGSIVLDFDARTNHNHGVKLRIKKAALGNLFNTTRKIF
jgi:hypothetical protein